MTRLLYKPVSLLLSVLGAILAGAIFKQVWKLAAGEEEAGPRQAGRGSMIAVGSTCALVGSPRDRLWLFGPFGAQS
jgi:hypothetical protein